ncbi:hypothetical protein FOXG_17728 [Fusarium oxysporum f. sp. lycopersici 4287]|uniref:Uncharacterized protein n=3 Tax=Fusarium oxysporum TaxID=5507 RepID=A0A0J9WDN2_FUSO4|nr:uncharacterized protein FOXG_17728 [Fusarium oxysporum f. sp. lycopersici 4287]EXK25644.1 hypothetical protein FOMG_17716 [Fusarium oxysporum f. sp. melonis 26406]KAJ9419962.1 hypothetical protein QL093DRAFT_2636890 [Fusarium oxysporum]KNB20815.1 hypothetical protein FOXG_17728 [Fusarium oxysporum f. sp. lycopersici 4287]
MARTRHSSSAAARGGKSATSSQKAAGKGGSSRSVKAKRAAKAPAAASKKVKLVRERTRGQVRNDLRKADRLERKAQKLEARTHLNPLEIADEDLPPIVVFTDEHFELPCLGCVRSCLAGKGELEHCKRDPTRRAERCALYESGGHKCEPIPNVAEPLVRVLKKALLDDKETAISNACIALRLQLASLYDEDTAHFFSARDKGTKPLLTIGEAKERALEDGFEEDGDPEGGESSAEQKAAARKIIRALGALL